MRSIFTFMLLACFSVLGFLGGQEACAQSGFVKQKFSNVFYFKAGGTGNGQHYGAALPIADGDIWAIPAGTVIEKVYVIVDTAITGSTAITVGDDDDPNGYVVDFAAAFSSAGTMFGYDAKAAGDYLKVTTAGATDAADIYVVPAAKYYGAAGKELKLDNTTANTAGTFRVVVEGYRLGVL